MTRTLRRGRAAPVSRRARRRRTLAVAPRPPAQAPTSTPGQIATSVKTNGVAYLKTLQATNGTFAGGLSNEWAFSALAAAGTAAVDVTPAGSPTLNARTVYQGQLAATTWPSTAPVVTDYERGALNAYAAGIDPARVAATRNLIANVISYWQPASPGYYGPPANFNGTVFAVLALAGAKTQAGGARVPQALLNSSITVMRANQHNDGGWDFPQAAGNPTTLAATSDIDMTGATMAAMCAAGVANTDSAIVAAKTFLKAKLVAGSGAFNSSFGANSDSNGWAVSGLNACGIPSQGADFTTTSHKTPIDFLIAQQVNPGGGFKYQPSNTVATAYSSIDAERALAGGGFTATPPTPVTTGATTWTAASGFTSGTASTLAVVIDNGTTVTPCSVSITPTGTTTLGAVLTAATGGHTVGLRHRVTPSTGTSTITAINGTTNTGRAPGRSPRTARTAATPTTAQGDRRRRHDRLKYGT